MLSDPEEAVAVRRGEKTIHQAADDAKAKRASEKPYRRQTVLSPEAKRANDEAVAEGFHFIELLQALIQLDPIGSRRKAIRSAIIILREAIH